MEDAEALLQHLLNLALGNSGRLRLSNAQPTPSPPRQRTTTGQPTISNPPLPAPLSMPHTSYPPHPYHYMPAYPYGYYQHPITHIPSLTFNLPMSSMPPPPLDNMRSQVLRPDLTATNHGQSITQSQITGPSTLSCANSFCMTLCSGARTPGNQLCVEKKCKTCCLAAWRDAWSKGVAQAKCTPHKLAEIKEKLAASSDSEPDIYENCSVEPPSHDAHPQQLSNPQADPVSVSPPPSTQPLALPPSTQPLTLPQSTQPMISPLATQGSQKRELAQPISNAWTTEQNKALQETEVKKSLKLRQQELDNITHRIITFVVYHTAGRPPLYHKAVLETWGKACFSDFSSLIKGLELTDHSVFDVYSSDDNKCTKSVPILPTDFYVCDVLQGTSQLEKLKQKGHPIKDIFLKVFINAKYIKSQYCKYREHWIEPHTELIRKFASYGQTPKGTFTNYMKSFKFGIILSDSSNDKEAVESNGSQADTSEKHPVKNQELKETLLVTVTSSNDLELVHNIPKSPDITQPQPQPQSPSNSRPRSLTPPSTPELLCPFCNQVLPDNLSPSLTSYLECLIAKTTPDPLPDNPNH
ncbi:hypothetical protein CVT24_011798 [Panaeolus cyanescens]|uniref:Uncharacterized protein n=1 Tax=Panaeolus cyanescens TaxID=181874 RepID=A0A409WDT5_9AGAR|nr:hypothetical protein CVT24_011798 [Panaeolus cyanescens]